MTNVFFIFSFSKTATPNTMLSTSTRSQALTWVTYGSVMYRLSKKVSGPTDNVLFTDLDHTLIKPKGKRKFPKDATDWQWLTPGTKTTLQSYIKAGYRIIIITNQKATKTKNNPQNAMIKIVAMETDLGMPNTLEAIILSKDDVFRKPSPMVKGLLGGWIKKPWKNIIYVGDAAGRERDFSASDYKFSLNMGMGFSLPELAFQGKQVAFDVRLEKPIKLYEELPVGSSVSFLTQRYENTVKNKRVVFIMVGPPASGKSTFANNFAASLNKKVGSKVFVLSQDLLGNKKKVKTEAKRLLADQTGYSVIIDRTNPSDDDRKTWSDLAATYQASSVIIQMNTNRALAEHLNYVRMKMAYHNALATGKDLAQALAISDKVRIPSIAYRIYHSKYEQPTNFIMGSFVLSDEKVFRFYFNQYT